MKPHYNRQQLSQALRDVGLKPGDVVFSHSNVGYFGLPEEGKTPEVVFQTILGAFQDVIGEEGTLVVPTFTYSFCKQQPFDPDRTPSTCGIFTEMLRHHRDAHRSHDPLYSVAAIGRYAKELTADAPQACFGPGSFWQRLLEADGMICNLNFTAASTFLHYVERCLNVPYRYDKLFTGELIYQGKSSPSAAIFFCRDHSNPDTSPAADFFHALARKRGIVRSASVGRGAVGCLSAADTYKFVEEEFKTNPWFLTIGAEKGKIPILIQPSATEHFGVKLSKNAGMEEIIEAFWKLPRDLISDGYDAALAAIATQLPLKIHEYPTGTHCWKWIVPEKWTCQEACLETLDGKRLFSYADNSLHVVSYSLPFAGEVSRQELFEHLHTYPQLPEAIPYKSAWEKRDWGLCCSQRLKETLTDECYRVSIKTSYSYNTLKVGEVVIAGESQESIVLCTYLDQPGANDGLTGVAVGIEVIRQLLNHSHLRYTYRLLFVPKTIGLAAYLSHNEDLIPQIKGVLCLQMLGLNNAHTLQVPIKGNTQIEKSLSLALKEKDSSARIEKLTTIMGNNQPEFNLLSGVKVPIMSLSRMLPPSEINSPYREYYSSYDILDLVSKQGLENSRNLLLAMIEILENSHPLT